MEKNIYFIRHAQAEHNVAADLTIRDPQLTPLGREQSRLLDAITRDTLQTTAGLIVCSPQVRALETMLLGLPSLKARLESEGVQVVVMDILQEVALDACDTPTYPPSAILSAQGGIFADLDLSGLSEGYASKKGIFALESVPERARLVRDWLFSREEQEIVVVAHGKILAKIVGLPRSINHWSNTEVKTFRFGDEKSARTLVVVDEAGVNPPTDQ